MKKNKYIEEEITLFELSKRFFLKFVVCNIQY